MKHVGDNQINYVHDKATEACRCAINLPSPTKSCLMLIIDSINLYILYLFKISN